MTTGTATVIDELQIGGLAEAAGVDGVRYILDAFWTSTEELSAQLRAALAENDDHNVAQIGHTLKGSSANIGAARMADRARDIEMAGRQGQIDIAKEALNAFGQDVAETREAIENILNRYG